MRVSSGTELRLSTPRDKKRRNMNPVAKNRKTNNARSSLSPRATIHLLLRCGEILYFKNSHYFLLYSHSSLLISPLFLPSSRPPPPPPQSPASASVSTCVVHSSCSYNKGPKRPPKIVDRSSRALRVPLSILCFNSLQPAREQSHPFSVARAQPFASP